MTFYVHNRHHVSEVLVFYLKEILHLLEILTGNLNPHQYYFLLLILIRSLGALTDCSSVIVVSGLCQSPLCSLLLVQVVSEDYYCDYIWSKCLKQLTNQRESAGSEVLLPSQLVLNNLVCCQIKATV